MTMIYRFSLISLLVFLLSACAVNMGPVPEDHFYRLHTDIHTKQLDRPILSGRLGIKKVLTSGLYNERAILYLDSKYPLELHRFRYHYWQNAPKYLIQENMRLFFRAAGAADMVSLYEPGMDADGVVVSRLSRFEVLKEEINTRVIVSLEIGLETNSQKQSAWSKEYTAKVVVQGATMHDSVASFDAALQEIYGAFIDDLKGKRYLLGGIN